MTPKLAALLDAYRDAVEERDRWHDEKQINFDDLLALEQSARAAIESHVGELEREIERLKIDTQDMFAVMDDRDKLLDAAKAVRSLNPLGHEPQWQKLREAIGER